MRRPLGRHMVLMIMSSQNRVHLFESKGIDHKRHVTQIRLHSPSAAHIRHLMTDFHLSVAMCSLSVPAPEIDGNVSTARCLKPYAGTAKPPHRYIARLNNFIFNVLHKPGTPFRES